MNQAFKLSITRKEAMELLQVGPLTEAAEIRRQYQKLYSDYNIRITNAPTPKLKQMYEAKLEDLRTALQILCPDPSADYQLDFPAIEPVAVKSPRPVERNRNIYGPASAQLHKGSATRSFMSIAMTGLVLLLGSGIAAAWRVNQLLHPEGHLRHTDGHVRHTQGDMLHLQGHWEHPNGHGLEHPNGHLLHNSDPLNVTEKEHSYDLKHEFDLEHEQDQEPYADYVTVKDTREEVYYETLHEYDFRHDPPDVDYDGRMHEQSQCCNPVECTHIVVNGLADLFVKRKQHQVDCAPCPHSLPCNHKMECQHKQRRTNYVPLERTEQVTRYNRVACVHKKECEHQAPCQHTLSKTIQVPCQHNQSCTHPIPCNHGMKCEHYIECQHSRVPCHENDPCTHKRGWERLIS